MKHKITLSLTLTLSLMLYLVTLPATAQTAPQRFKTDSGVITLGADQKLRVTVATGDINADQPIRVRFGWRQYEPQGCSGMPQMCRHIVVNQGVTPVETPGPDDAVSFELNGAGIGGTGPVRVIVESNRPDVRVLGIIFDTSTQRVVAILHPFGDF